MFITDLSRGKIPYPEQFPKKSDYEQESLIRGLQLKDILCTRTDWINLGRDPSNLEICRYEDGDENSYPLKASHTRTCGRIASCIMKVQEFPIYLLEPNNRVIGDVLGRAFEPLAPPSPHVILFWLRELLRIEIALQNKLDLDPDAVHTDLLQVMRTKMVDYSSFYKVKKSLSIFINLWEKTFCSSFSKFYDEFSNQLVISQLRMIRGWRTGELDE